MQSDFFLRVDRWAEMGLVFYVYAHPQEAEDILVRRCPVGLFETHARAIAAAMVRLTQEHLSFSWKNIMNAAMADGWHQGSVEVGWRLMMTTDAEYMAMDPDRLIHDVKEAYLDRNRISDINELAKLVNEPNDYRAKLAEILRRERSVCPVEGIPDVESAEELNVAEVRPATSLVGDGLLNQEGLMWIHSRGGSGKTFLALQLAGALCANHRWLGFDTGDSYQRVLYLQGELDRSWWQKRSRALRNLVSAPLQNLQFCHERMTLLEWDHRHRLIITKGLNVLEHMVERYRPNIIFIDPLAKFYSLDENSTDQNREFDNALYDFRRRNHVTMVLVHHDRKPGPSDDYASVMRGSSVLQAGADCSVILRRASQGREIWLDWDKVRHAAQPASTQLLQRPDGFFEVVEDIEPHSE